MPLWLLIIVVVAITIAFCIFVHILWLVFVGCSIRDNVVFDNKYDRKVFVLQEKLRKYDEKMKERIAYLKYKSTYAKNIVILHEKSLDIPVFISNEDLKNFTKKKGSK